MIGAALRLRLTPSELRLRLSRLTRLWLNLLWLRLPGPEFGLRP